MRSRIVIFIFFVSVLSLTVFNGAPSYGQDAPGLTAPLSESDWESQIDAAAMIEEPEDRLATLLRIEEKANGPLQIAATQTHIGSTLIDLGRPGEAIFWLKKANALVNENFADNNQIMDTVENVLMLAYSEAGRSEDSTKIANGMTARKDKLLGDIWSRNDLGLVHRQTAMTCPNVIEKMAREDTVNYSAVGQDVGCAYKFLSESQNIISLYFTRFDGTNSSEHSGGLYHLIQSWGEDRLIVRERSAAFKAVNGAEVLESIFYAQEADQYTGMWTARLEGWTMKTRISWAGDLGRNFGSDKTKIIFQRLFEDVPKHIALCKASSPQTQISAGKVEGLFEHLMPLALQHPPFSPEARSETECFISSNPGETRFIVFQPNAKRIYSIEGSTVGKTMDIYLVKDNTAATLSGSQDLYLLKGSLIYTEDDGMDVDANTILVSVYDSIPTPQQIHDDLDNFGDGNSKMIGYIDYLPSGKTRINFEPE